MALDFHIGESFESVISDETSHRYSLSCDDHHKVIWCNRKHIENSRQARRLLDFIADSKFEGEAITELISDLEYLKAKLLCNIQQRIVTSLIAVADAALVENLGVYTICD